MLKQTLSTPWVRALAVNKRDADFDAVEIWPGPPESANPLTRSGYNAPGAVDIGQGGGTACHRIKVMPFCEGQPGSVFWLRVLGWTPIGTIEDNANKTAWVFTRLAEFLCVAGDIRGPMRQDNVQVTTNALQPTENICDGLSLMAGVIGLSGFVNSNTPGNGFPAFAAIEVFGSRKVSFDFAYPSPGPDFPGIGMNCFWSRL